MLSPSGASEKIMPQNLSRGLPNVTTTIHPETKGPSTVSCVALLSSRRELLGMERLSLP
jgi:hypothetical protein